MTSTGSMPARFDGRSSYLVLRKNVAVVLAAVTAGLVWLPRVPSILSAVATTLLVSVLLAGWVKRQDGWYFGSASVLVVLFTILRLLALWNERPDLGGIDDVVSLVVSLAIFLSMAVPRWNTDLAQWVVGSLSLAGTTVAAIFWWLSRGYSVAAGSAAIGIEFVAQGINRNDFGFVVALAAILAFMFTHLHQCRPLGRLLWAALGVFDLAFLVALGSRTSLVLALLGVVMGLILGRPRCAWWVAGVSTALVVLLPRWLAWIVRTGHAVPETVGRGAELVQALISGDASQIVVASAGRTTIWQAGLATFARSPIWGTGPEGLRSSVLQSTGLYTYAHSTLIMLLAESGLVGAIFFYAPFLIVAVQLCRSLRYCRGTERHIAATLLACTITILLLSPFATTGLDKTAWILLALGASLGNRCGRATILEHTSRVPFRAPTGTPTLPTQREPS